MRPLCRSREDPGQAAGPASRTVTAVASGPSISKMQVYRPPSTHPLTLVGHADAGEGDDTALAPPIIQTSTFRARSAADFQEMAGPRYNRNYTRDGNPTFTRVEKIIAGLEGAETALLMASGMGAMSASVLAHVSKGEHVVAQRSHYMGTTQLLTDVLPRFGVEVTHVDQTSISALEAAVRETTRLIIVETPANPLLKLTDLAAVAAIARPRGILTICDSTIGTPINQQPLQLGIDLVMHSATKFLGGHHDLLAGVVAGQAKLIDPIWHLMVALGPVPDPFSAWLLLRGLRTLPLRVERHNHSALQIARFLETHAAVAAVHYPGLEQHPQHELARRQMKAGFGGLLSFELNGNIKTAQRFLDAVSLASRAVSFGGFESLITHPASMWTGSLGADQAQQAGISPSLIRFSAGLEHPEDLIADLNQALSAVQPG